MARSVQPTDWMDNLPLILLGICVSTRDGNAVSPAHLLYGAPLRLPGEFFPPGAPQGQVSASAFVAQLQRALHDMSPFPADFHSSTASTSAVPAALWSSPAVFVRVDAVWRPLTRPYVGPYRVLERNNKTFVLSRSGKPWTVSLDRLKPLFDPVMSAPLTDISASPSSSSATLPQPQAPPTPHGPPAPPSPPEQEDICSPSPDSSAPTSRFGRALRPPDRYGV